jgi:hypothetical protein
LLSKNDSPNDIVFSRKTAACLPHGELVIRWLKGLHSLPGEPQPQAWATYSELINWQLLISTKLCKQSETCW